MSQAEAHACVVDGIGDAVSDGVTAIRDYGKARERLDGQRQRRMAANGAADDRSLDPLDDADVCNSRNLSARRTGEYGKELEEPAGVAGAALDDLREQAHCDNHSVMGSARGADCRNDWQRHASQTDSSELEPGTHAARSICCADAEGVRLGVARCGDSALGKFALAQLLGGVGLRNGRDAGRDLRSPIKRIGFVVPLVATHPRGIERRFGSGSNHCYCSCGGGGGVDDWVLGICEARNRLEHIQSPTSNVRRG